MYPNDAPGAYTAFNAMAYIRDNITAIDKLAMVNSIGRQISQLQQFINSHNCGTSALPVQEGFFGRIDASGIHLVNPNSVSPSADTWKFKPDDDGDLIISDTGNTIQFKLSNTLSEFFKVRHTGTGQGLTFDKVAMNAYLEGMSLRVAEDIYTEALTNFSGVYAPTGFVGTLVRDECSYKCIGNTVHLWVAVYGTSNATTLTFDLPYPPFNTPPCPTTLAFPCVIADNGALLATPGKVILTAGSTTASCHAGLNLTGGWTNHDIKGVEAYLCYEME